MILRKSTLGTSVKEWLAHKNQSISSPSLNEGWIALNDPEAAKEFVAVWGVA